MWLSAAASLGDGWICWRVFIHASKKMLIYETSAPPDCGRGFLHFFPPQKNAEIVYKHGLGLDFRTRCTVYGKVRSMCVRMHSFAEGQSCPVLCEAQFRSFFTSSLSENLPPFVLKVEQSKVLVKEGGVQLTLTIVDTPGFGDAVDNSNW